MSKLIDEIVFNGIKCDTEINGVWYCCKPLGVRTWKYRIAEAWKVLCGKAETYHYKEDEIRETDG